jgi:hypothetical protein
LGDTGLPPPERYHLRLEYLWWEPLPQGELQKGFSETEGTLLDVEADLGVTESQANPLRASLRASDSWKVRGSWRPLDFKGQALARQGFTYGDITVFRNDEVRTSLKGNYVTGEVEWDFARGRQGFLGALLGVKYFDVDTLLVDVDTSERVAETERLPIPVVGLAGRVYASSRLSIEAEFSGMRAGSRGHVFEVYLLARFHITDWVAVGGGYHRLSLEGKDERDFFSLAFDTWTAGVEISL